MPQENIESPSGFVWRHAQAEGIGLTAYCALVLGLSYAERNGDLDVFLTEGGAVRVATVIGLPSWHLKRMALPFKAVRSVWVTNSKSHSGRVWVCPECLNGSHAIAKREWRSSLSVVCPEHLCYLVGSCAECGETLRYQVRFCGTNFGHWLDQWPWCVACGAKIQPGRQAPERLVQFGREWCSRLAATTSRSQIDEEWALAGQLVQRLVRMPSLVGLFARLVDLPNDSDAPSVAACCLFGAYSRELFVGDANPALHFQRCLLGLSGDDRAAAYALAELIG